MAASSSGSFASSSTIFSTGTSVVPISISSVASYERQIYIQGVQPVGDLFTTPLVVIVEMLNLNGDRAIAAWPMPPHGLGTPDAYLFERRDQLGQLLGRGAGNDAKTDLRGSRRHAFQDMDDCFGDQGASRNPAGLGKTSIKE